MLDLVSQTSVIILSHAIWRELNAFVQPITSLEAYEVCQSSNFSSWASSTLNEYLTS